MVQETPKVMLDVRQYAMVFSKTSKVPKKLQIAPFVGCAISILVEE